ncbi:hypothetical protein H7I53_11800 [Mycolicibacterium pulveris]|uniref:Uncharacterized protein n=1 Tax=Mycolicibacterium pulveris TaxID=36813 RepID=A0A7I7UGP6_MYCPV|nr:Nif11-like leader peptide family natural product precursor [Mycolicibacterium pulveris]MCV6980903.1 hypothetical protein [Mycolicibacterium pulveris]BBY80512.1 hypothetical protein MPUL_16700 [Mycolicibacterium pulveris]
MRLVATMLLWLVTTLLLAVAVPAMWAQRNVVSEDGYAAFSASAAEDPQLQSAMAAELASQIISFAADNGYTLDREMVRRGTVAYTGSAGFPGQFGQANRIAHRWMFTDSVQREAGTDRWFIDIAPMLNDPSIGALLGEIDLDVPQTLTVPITVPETTGLHPGRLRQVSTWGPWITVGTTILTGVFALLTLAASRSRGKALAALGVSALLVGAAGWAGLEVARGYVNDALNRTTGDIRVIADVVVGHAEDSLHRWFNLTLAAGAALVVFGVLVALLGGLRRRDA